ncbi:Hypothetical protein I595_2047 [Croceitalea dokdonensis DOKDO 023]|uniref:Uncharacterized protein n=1 Tax=Croceitalea dokdonensis DOKDO 023 TaxID=1300341 RepID=A0A0P7B0U6_9FLAO|nr:Hypothetical protein I595_2047 [Croceitalea dokdonensis DOKDO 023]
MGTEKHPWVHRGNYLAHGGVNVARHKEITRKRKENNNPLAYM